MRLPSSSPRQATAFFAPLKRKTTTFVVEGREANLHLAQLILSLASSLKWKVLVLDTDAFYAANVVVAAVPERQGDEQKMAGTLIRIPTEDSRLEDWLVDSLLQKYELLIVDDLNTLHHLLSYLDMKSSSRRLHFIGRILSYLARSENRTVFLTVYKNVMDSSSTTATTKKVYGESTRSLSKQSDLVVLVELEGDFLRFKGEAWTNNLFSVRL